MEGAIGAASDEEYGDAAAGNPNSERWNTDRSNRTRAGAGCCLLA
jgi:hypothetical protein